MQDTIANIRESASTEISSVASTGDIEHLRVRYLGRKGPIQDLMKGLKDVAAEQRPAMVKLINELKQYVTLELNRLEMTIQQQEEESQLANEKIDVTLPGRRQWVGGRHLLTQVLDEIIDILVGMGFSVQYGPHIESDYYNFEALNMDKDHPARDMQDTYYLDPETVLRTHTSNIQARVMESNQPPIRVIAPGKVFRNESVSARSHVLFHQVEGLYIDKGVSFADLLATMDEFLEKLMGGKVETRYRPSYFPFVEPGTEVDVRCLLCKGKGCSICKGTGWLEVLGAGMVHPEVLKSGGLDPEEYTGYAWGMGLERLVIIRHAVDDIRKFTQNDLRFLRQFSRV